MKLHHSVPPLFLAGALLSLVPLLPAQQNPSVSPDPTTTLSVDARLVNIPAVVRDKKGALVQNLTQADFTLQVDGHPQTLRYFDLDANLPLTLGLLVDTSLSQRSVIDEERTASGTFLDQMLTAPPNRDPDKAFVLQFAGQVELLQDLTASHTKLQAALKQLGTPAADSNSNDSTDDRDNSRNGRRARRATALYDAAFLASDELMSKQKGRKALIILSDGVDRNSKESLAKAIEAAQRADTVIYAIYFKSEEPRRDEDRQPGGGGRNGGGFPGGGGYPAGGGGGGQRAPAEPPTDGKKFLERMAHETGGRLFEVSRKQSTPQIYTQIAEELRARYRLGYTPDALSASDGYHQIELTLSQPDLQKKLTVQTRDGYYTGKP